jgi:hypothetical protein
VIASALHVVFVISVPTVAATYPLTILVGALLPVPLAGAWWNAAYALWPAANGAMLGYLVARPPLWWTAGGRSRAP